MKYIQGNSRKQIVLYNSMLDDIIEKDNEVRRIDEFVDSLDLATMGFKNLNIAEEGRPGYHPSDLLKLYIYGYMNRTRSSRELEKETKRNTEVMWLIKELKPDHNTISNFRRDNSDAIRNVFRSTVSIAKNHDLIGGRIVAGDSVKLRAQNSKKNNYNAEKIARHLKYIDEKLDEYNKVLSESDDKKLHEEVEKKIENHNKHKAKYNELSAQLKETGELQISTSDPDSRQLIVRNNITEVAYNTQTTNDPKHNLILDYLVTSNNDSHALYTMVSRATEILGKKPDFVLFDKGYHTASEIGKCFANGIETIVAVPNRPITSQAPNPAYNYEHFIYNKKEDYFICPEGKVLISNGNWYNSKSNQFKQYKTKACKDCKERSKCTTSEKNGRIIERTKDAEYVERNKENTIKHKEIYQLRQQIVEHPYGTIKRQWGFDHTLIKRGINRVSSDIGFIMLSYNLRRIFNLLPKLYRGGCFFMKIGIIRANLSIINFINQKVEPEIRTIYFSIYRRKMISYAIYFIKIN